MRNHPEFFRGLGCRVTIHQDLRLPIPGFLLRSTPEHPIGLSRWAETRHVPQVAFKPGWTKHAKAAPFKRNDAMLGVLPIGVLVFPGAGIQDNLADKARKPGIPVYRFASGGA